MCYNAMWDGWKLENVEVFFFGFFDMNNFLIPVVSFYIRSINITRIKYLMPAYKNEPRLSQACQFGPGVAINFSWNFQHQLSVISKL